MFSAKGIGKSRLVIFPYNDNRFVLSEQEKGIIEVAESSANAAFGNVLKYTKGSIVVLEVDSKIRMTYASESFYRMKKSKSKKMRFLWDEFIFSIYKTDRENVVNALQSAKETGNMIDISFRIYNRSLKFVWYNIRAVRNENNNNEIIVLISDVTELLQSNIQLDYLLQ
jgi:PAS domain-containing protein